LEAFEDEELKKRVIAVFRITPFEVVVGLV
jgi:hypothetical protein